MKLEARLARLEQQDAGMPTQWRWIIAEDADAVKQAKADHIALHGDTPSAGWIISYLAPGLPSKGMIPANAAGIE